MIFYYIRHGDPIYNPDGLTPLGERQGESVGRRLSNSGINKIFSSPLNRAYQTAKPLAELIKKDIITEAWAYECFDEFAVTHSDGRRSFCMNLTAAEYMKEPVYSMTENWWDIPQLKTAKVKEGWERITFHTDEFFASLGYKREGRIYKITNPTDDRIAFFCHDGLGRVILPYLLNIPLHYFWAGFEMNHTGVSIFEFKNNENGETVPRCLTFSDCSHLYKDNLPYLHSNKIKL